MKKSLLLLISLFSLSLGACDSSVPEGSQSASQSTSEQTTSVNEQIYQIYQLYLSNGGAQTYEEWLASIKGEKGEPGKDGSTILSGEGNPSSSLGKTNDLYIDKNVFSIYQKGENGWLLIYNTPYYSLNNYYDFYSLDNGEWLADCFKSRYRSTIEVPSAYCGGTVSGVKLISDFEMDSTTKIVLPETITQIGDGYHNGGFYFSNLKEINIPRNVKTIKNWSIPFGASEKTKEDIDLKIVIPDSVETIESVAFIFRKWDCDYNVTASLFCESTSKPLGWQNGWNDSFQVYWYSESKPVFGNYWHYVNGEPTIWEDSLSLAGKTLHCKNIVDSDLNKVAENMIPILESTFLVFGTIEKSIELWYISDSKPVKDFSGTYQQNGTSVVFSFDHWLVGDNWTEMSEQEKYNWTDMQGVIEYDKLVAGFYGNGRYNPPIHIVYH